MKTVPPAEWFGWDGGYHNIDGGGLTRRGFGGKDEGQIGISPLALIEGKLSNRALGLVVEWASLITARESGMISNFLLFMTAHDKARSRAPGVVSRLALYS